MGRMRFTRSLSVIGRSGRVCGRDGSGRMLDNTLRDTLKAFPIRNSLHGILVSLRPDPDKLKESTRHSRLEMLARSMFM
jgi:hypothetical protein